MSNIEDTVASLKAMADEVSPGDLIDAAQAAFWDQAMRHWFGAHRGDLEAAMVKVARIALGTDGAVALLVLYVTTARIEQSTHACSGRAHIQAALRRLADDLADQIPRTWGTPP